MFLPDVNILVYAHRRDVPNHDSYENWLDELVNGEEAFGISDIVCSGFLRIVTNPAIFDPPSTLRDALTFLEEVRSSSNCVLVSPGARHWQLFVNLCQTANARGNLVPDAFLAALAIESGSEWITEDRGFARFPGLRWRRPF
jgi:toxin-antitoxin system PIN domain toxin